MLAVLAVAAGCGDPGAADVAAASSARASSAPIELGWPDGQGPRHWPPPVPPGPLDMFIAGVRAASCADLGLPWPTVPLSAREGDVCFVDNPEGDLARQQGTVRVWLVPAAAAARVRTTAGGFTVDGAALRGEGLASMVISCMTWDGAHQTLAQSDALPMGRYSESSGERWYAFAVGGRRVALGSLGSVGSTPITSASWTVPIPTTTDRYWGCVSSSTETPENVVSAASAVVPPED